jgi:hypothetical protein
VSSGPPPPPPQVSPDGKFYWDGTRWLPIQVATDRPESLQTKAFKGGCFGTFGVLAAIGVVVLAVYLWPSFYAGWQAGQGLGPQPPAVDTQGWQIVAIFFGVILAVAFLLTRLRKR